MSAQAKYKCPQCKRVKYLSSGISDEEVICDYDNAVMDLVEISS